MKIKITAALSAILLLTALFASCGKDEPITVDPGGAAEQNDLPENEDTPKEEPAEPQRVMPDLPEADFGGRVYKVLGREDSTYAQFINFEIDALEITGEPVNDAVYNRNRRLEEKYKVVIEAVLQSDPAGALQKLVKAGDDEYALAFIIQDKIGALATSGTFYDLKTLKYLDFDKPWWNLKVNDSVSIGGRLYYSTNDFNMMDKNRTYMIAYNKDMAQSFDLGNLYELVYQKKWTVDKMIELCRVVALDIDGDGEMTDADCWGLGMDSYNAFYAFYNACENAMVTKDSADYPVLSVNNERTISTIDKLLKLTNDKTFAFYCNDFNGKTSYDFWSMSGNVFKEGRGLFTGTFTHGLKFYAASDVNYGVLPFPKYDEKQEEYISYAENYHAALFAVPSAVQDTDFAAFMLEAVSAASKYEVLPYYYEVSTKTKYTQDEESPKMLDIIFNGIRYDLGCLFNWGGINDIFRVNIPQGGANNFVSSYEKLEPKITAAMEKTVEAFNALN